MGEHMKRENFVSSQLNLKLSKKILDDANEYVEEYGYNNVQELIRESIRDKIYSDKLNPIYLKRLLTDSEFHDGIGVEESEKLFDELMKKANE